MRRSLCLLLTIALGVVAGCTPAVDAPPTPAAGPTDGTVSTIVDADGFVLRSGAVTVSGDAGVAAPGTTVTVTGLGHPADSDVPVDVVAGFDIVLDGGAQPASSVEVSLELRASDADRIDLFTAARDVMTEALAVGGTSFDTLYVNVNGESGYFARGLNAYGREGEPCPRCGTPLRREAFTNRSSFFCPVCQRRR